MHRLILLAVLLWIVSEVVLSGLRKLLQGSPNADRLRKQAPQGPTMGRAQELQKCPVCLVHFAPRVSQGSGEASSEFCSPECRRTASLGPS